MIKAIHESVKRAGNVMENPITFMFISWYKDLAKDAFVITSSSWFCTMHTKIPSVKLTPREFIGTQLGTYKHCRVLTLGIFTVVE